MKSDRLAGVRHRRGETAIDRERLAVDVRRFVACEKQPHRGEFVWLTSDLRTSLLDGQVRVGNGVAMASDYRVERYGLRAMVDLERERWSLGLLAGWAPAQAGRGWIDLEPHGAWRWERERFSVELEGRVGLRRVDVGTRHGPLSLGVLGAQLTAEASIDERWTAALEVTGTLYDRDLSTPRFADADFGPAVSIAGRPERWAVQARGSRVVKSWLWVEAGLGAIDYAGGHGQAALARAALRFIPRGGWTIEPFMLLTVGAGGAATHDPIRAMGGLALGFRR